MAILPTLDGPSAPPFTAKGYEEVINWHIQKNIPFTFLRNNAIILQEQNKIVITTRPQEENVVGHLYANRDPKLCHWFWVFSYTNKSLFKEMYGTHIKVDPGKYVVTIQPVFSEIVMEIIK